jgi:Flp pilus assembly protein TadD
MAEQAYADSHLELLKARIEDEAGQRDAALLTYRHALELDPNLQTVQEDIERLEKRADN